MEEIKEVINICRRCEESKNASLMIWNCCSFECYFGFLYESLREDDRICGFKFKKKPAFRDDCYILESCGEEKEIKIKINGSPYYLSSLIILSKFEDCTLENLIKFEEELISRDKELCFIRKDGYHRRLIDYEPACRWSNKCVRLSHFGDVNGEEAIISAVDDLDSLKEVIKSFRKEKIKQVANSTIDNALEEADMLNDFNEYTEELLNRRKGIKI